MTKHKTITSFVAVALLAVAATATTLRPLSSKSHPAASAGIMSSISELKTDVNKLATDDYDDQSFLFRRSANSHRPRSPRRTALLNTPDVSSSQRHAAAGSINAWG
jgi:hypothetical protein